MSTKETIINSYNIFVDSRNSTYRDECDIDLTIEPIVAQSGEYINVTLNYFNMENNLYNLNFRNSTFNLTGDYGNLPFDEPLQITNENYYNLHEIASNFAVKVGKMLQTKTSKTFRVKDIKNTILRRWTPFNVNGGIDSTPGRAVCDGNQLLDITLDAIVETPGTNSDGDPITNTTVVNHGLSNVKISFDEDSELYLILGGLKPDPVLNDSVMKVDISLTEIRIRGYFPMKRASGNHTFLRTNLECNNFSDQKLNASTALDDKYFVKSNILGLFNNNPSNSEYIEYTNTSDIFTIRLAQSTLSKFKIWLTDHKNRRLVKNTSPNLEGTSSGLQTSDGIFESNQQNTRGNLHFTAALNIKVIKLVR
jgi:hypothetical protein